MSDVSKLLLRVAQLEREREQLRAAYDGWLLVHDRTTERAEKAEAEVARLREALANQLDEHKHTWLVARAEVEGAGVSANLFEAEPSTQRARALLRDAPPPPVEQVKEPEDKWQPIDGGAFISGPDGFAPPPSPAGARLTAGCSVCGSTDLMHAGCIITTEPKPTPARRWAVRDPTTGSMYYGAVDMTEVEATRRAAQTPGRLVVEVDENGKEVGDG